MNHFNLFYFFLKMLYLLFKNILGVHFLAERSYACVQTYPSQPETASFFATNLALPQFSQCGQDHIKHCVEGEAVLNRKYKI